MPKYGVYTKTKYFGSKFFMGTLAKEYPEHSIHYLMVKNYPFSFLGLVFLQKGEEWIESIGDSVKIPYYNCSNQPIDLNWLTKKGPNGLFITWYTVESR